MAAAGQLGFATGGTVTTVTDGGTNYRVHTFTSSGTLLVYGSLIAEYLIVGGGGAPGESWSTGGGGGGGVLYTPAGCFPFSGRASMWRFDSLRLSSHMA